MTKKDRRKVFLVALLVAVLTAAVALNEEAREAARGNRPAWKPSYYSRLEERCEDSCCRSSVAEMRVDHGKIQPYTGCAAGESAEMLACASSYRWCH